MTDEEQLKRGEAPKIPHFAQYVPCTMCNGKGKSGIVARPCVYCRGKGKLPLMNVDGDKFEKRQ